MHYHAHLEVRTQKPLGKGRFHGPDRYVAIQWVRLFGIFGIPVYREDGDVSISDGFNAGGYDWCIQHWGTKWNVGDTVQLRRFARSVLFTFDTAWSPPTPIVFALSERFPGFRFSLRYWEGGVGFQGHVVCKDGEVLDEDQREYRGRRGG